MYTICHQSGVAKLLLCAALLLQNCRQQRLAADDNSADALSDVETRQEDLSNILAEALAASPPTAQLLSQSTFLHTPSPPAFQRQPSFVALPPLRAMEASPQQAALPPTDSYVQQAQGGRLSPTKRQRTAADVLTPSSTLKTPVVAGAESLCEVWASPVKAYKKPNCYIERPKETEKLKKVLEQQGVCILHGYGGSGKSTLACHYAQDVSESAEQQTAWFIPSDSLGKIQTGFQDIAARLGIDYRALIELWKLDPRKYRQELSRAIYDALEESGQCLLLILDNVGANFITLIEDLTSHISIPKVKVIITVRDSVAFLGYEKVALSDFLLEEGVAYIAQRLKAIPGRFAESDTKSLSSAARHLVGVVGLAPLELNLAMGFLHQNRLQTITCYTEELQNFRKSLGVLPKLGVVPAVNMGLAILDEVPQQVMRYSTSLDTDFIPASLLVALLKEPEVDNLKKILQPLESMSLVTIITERLDIKIHQSVQSSCQTYCKWRGGADFSEVELLQRLVGVLSVMMPWVEASPDARWEVGRLYAPHVAQVLAKAVDVLGEHPAIASLLELMGNYQKEVTCNYQQARLYFEQALAMRQKLCLEEVPNLDVAKSLNNVGVIYEKLGDVQKAFVYLEQALTIRQKFYGEVPHPDVASSLNSLGIACEKLGEIQKGLTYQEQALKMRQVFYAEAPHPDVPRSLHNVGAAYETLGELLKGLAYKEQALMMFRTLYGELPHADIAMSLNNVGVAYEKLGNTSKGLIYQEQALTMCQMLYSGVPHPDVAISLNNVGIAYEKLGELRKGLTYQEQALTMRQKLYRVSLHPDVARSFYNVGMVYEKLGELQKGLTYKEQALVMLQRLYGEALHPDIARSLDSVGVSYEKLGDVLKSLSYKEQALTMRQKLYGESPHPDLASSLNNVGIVYHKLGNAQKGLAYKEAALKMRQKLYGEAPHPDVASSLNNVGVAYETLGDLQKSFFYKERGLTMRKQLYGETPHPDLANSLNNLGVSYDTLGDVPKSIAYFKQALAMRQKLYREAPHPDLANSLNSVGVAHRRLGEVQEAKRYFEEGLAVSQKLDAALAASYAQTFAQKLEALRDLHVAEDLLRD